MIYITGDTHGKFDRIKTFCYRMNTTENDVMIVLGDAGLNFYGYVSDMKKKRDVSNIGITFFCIHGNHEMRPETVPGYELKEWNGGKVWVQPEFPNILFAKDGEIYRLAGKTFLVIGGAYSIDKEYRLRMGYKWFSDEQPSDEIKQYVERQLDKAGWKVDAVLSHTCPRKYEPVEAFLPGIDQCKVDKSTENWLDTIEDRLQYKEWYCGHWHIDKKADKIRFFFNDIESLSDNHS